MPSVAITWCERCGVSSEHRISRGPIPVVGACSCGGQRQISRIVFRPRGLPGAAGREHEGRGMANPRPGLRTGAASGSLLRG